MSKKKILFYDIETAPCLFWGWRTGKQFVSHNQLAKPDEGPQIICIAYAWNDGKPAKSIGWDYQKQDSVEVVRKFDKIVEGADIIIGKNNNRFDDKHLNTQRLLGNLPSHPDWMTDCTDDLEKQIRKYFYLPSYSLDYISQLLGFGGKDRMVFADWIDIVEKRNKKSYFKMMKYCKKDVEDTRAVWDAVIKYCKPRRLLHEPDGAIRCTHCNSNKLKRNGTRWVGRSHYQMYWCNSCNGYAGKVLLKGTRPPIS